MLSMKRGVVRWAGVGLLAVVSTGWAQSKDASKGAATKAEAQPAAAQEVAPLASRDLIEKLKSLRSEILLEEEHTRLLKAKLERTEFEVKLAEAQGVKPATKGASARIASSSARPPAQENPTEGLQVKAVTTRPFKEAIVTYRGRVYTVRPGDKLGDIEIRDVTETGVVTGNTAGGRPVLMGR